MVNNILDKNIQDFYSEGLRNQLNDTVKFVKADPNLFKTCEKIVNSLDVLLYNDITIKEKEDIEDLIVPLTSVISTKEYYLKRNIQLLDSKETDQIKKLSQDCMMFLTILKSTPVSKPKQDSNTERIDYENASNDASNGYNKSYESHNINKLNEKIDNPVYPNTSL